MDPRHTTCTSNTGIAGQEFVLTMVLDQCGPQNAVHSRKYSMGLNKQVKHGETPCLLMNPTGSPEVLKLSASRQTYAPRRLNQAISWGKSKPTCPNFLILVHLHADTLTRCFPSEHVSGRMALDTSDVSAIYCPQSPIDWWLRENSQLKYQYLRTIPIWCWYVIVVFQKWLMRKSPTKPYNWCLKPGFPLDFPHLPTYRWSITTISQYKHLSTIISAMKHHQQLSKDLRHCLGLETWIKLFS